MSEVRSFYAVENAELRRQLSPRDRLSLRLPDRRQDERCTQTEVAVTSAAEIALRKLLRECAACVYRQRKHGKHDQDRIDAEALWARLVELSEGWGEERIR